jgi:chromosome segregation ATPase
MRDSWLTDHEDERPHTDRAYEVASSGRAWSASSSASSSIPMSPQAAAARESAVSRAIELTKMTRDELSRDLLAPHHSVTKGIGSINPTTVGISYEEKNQTITQILVGGPAFKCRKVHKGDVIVAIDGQPVADDGKDIQDRLRGVDVPGSLVVISLRKASGRVEQVRLQRMKSSLIADKRKLFDLFTKAADRAKKDEVMEKYIDEAVELWTQTMIEEHDHEMKCEENVQRMQKSCNKWLEELLAILGKGNMDLSGQMQVRLAALELENTQSKDELRAAINKTMSLWRDVEILQAEISGNKRWARSQIINSKLESEVTRREMVQKTRILRERESMLNDALKDAARFQAEAEEFRRQLMQQKDTTRVVERDCSRVQAENGDLREQLRMAEEALKKAQDWNEQNSGRDSAEVARLKKIIKENESEILRLNKEIHELKLQTRKAIEEVEVCRKEVIALQQIRTELEVQVKRHAAVTDAQKQTIHGLEEQVRSLSAEMQQAKKQWEADRTSLWQKTQQEKEQAVVLVREQMEREFHTEREQLRMSQKQIVTLKAEIEQLSNKLHSVERVWQTKLSDEQRVRASLEADLENSRAALSNLRAAHEHDILKIRKEMDTAHKELQQRDRDIQELQAQVVKLTRENNGLDQHVRDLQVEVERLRAEFKSREQHFVEMQHELERLTRSLRDIKQEFDNERNRYLTSEEEVRRLRVIVDEQDDELSRARAELADSRALEAEKINRANETKYQLDILKQELGHVKRGMALKVSATVVELQQQLREEMRKKVDYERRVWQTVESVRKLHLEGKAVLTDKLEHVSALLASVTDEVIRMRSSDTEYESIIRALREELAKVRKAKEDEILMLQTNNRDLQAALDHANRSIHDYEQEVYELKAELATYKRDLEKLLADRSQWEINMQRLQDELAEKTRQIEKITRPLESKILALNKQVHELNVALEKMTERYNVATETLKKEVEKVRSLEFEIEELKRKLGRLPELEREMRRETERVTLLRENLEKELKTKNAELDKLRVQITSLQKELNQKSDALNRATNELKQRIEDVADLREKLQESERSAAAGKKRFEGIIVAKDEEIEKLRRQLTEMRNGVNELNEEILVLRNNQTDKENLMQYMRRLQQAWEATRELEMQVHNLQREASERKQWAITKAQCMIFKVEESWKDRLRKEMKSKETVLRERDIARREIEDLKRQLSQLSDKDRQLRTEIDDLKSKLRQSNDKDALVRQLRTENDSCQAEIARLKAELNSLKTQREKLLPDRDRAHLVRCRELLRLLKKSTQNAALSETRVVTTSVSGKNLFDVKFCFRAQYPLHAVPCDYVFELILDSFSSRGCTDN